MTLVESTCSMLEFAKLSKSFWVEKTLFTWCYVQNGSFASIMFEKPIVNVGQVESHVSSIFICLVRLLMKVYTKKNIKNLAFNLLKESYGGHDGVKGYHL
jgi:hypothetical protein